MEPELHPDLLGTELADRAVLETALSAHLANQQFTSLAGAYVRRSAVASSVLLVHSWHTLPGLLVWAAVLGWGGCAALAMSFELLARKAQQQLADVLSRTHGIVRLHFGPSPPPAVSTVLVHLLTPVSGILWAHAMRPSLLPAGLVTLGAKLWLLLLVLWLGTSADERVR
jgi:hypothetical protein